MKKIVYIILGVFAIIACSKETPDMAKSGFVSEQDGQGVYTFTAYMNDVTKATINSGTGVFYWTGDEKIAIWDSVNGEFVTFTIDTYSNTGLKAAKFKTTGAKSGASFSGNVAYYPASIAATSAGSPTYNFPNEFDNLADAAKGFPMEGTVSNGEIKFTHLGGLIDFTLTNVPSFTTALVLNNGTSDIMTVPVTPDAGSVHAILPIPVGTYALTVKLLDDNTPTKNAFFSKTRSSKTYSARNYYPINNITLGHLLTFTNEAAWSTPKVHIWQTSNTSNNTDITTSGTYPKKLFLRNTNIYYALLDSGVETWTGEGSAIGVQFYSSDANKTETSCVYLYRNIDFTIPDGGGMKTNYRVYYDNSSSKWESIKTYVWGDTGVYVRWYNWDNRTIYYRATDKSSWGWGTPTASNYRKVYGQSDQYAFYEVESSFWNKTIEWFGIGGDGSSQEITNPSQKDLGKSQFFYKSNVAWGHDNTEQTKKEVLSTSEWPGDVISADNGLYYFEFTDTKYGYGYNIVFSDASNSSNITYDTHLMINREYTLPL